MNGPVRRPAPPSDAGYLDEEDGDDDALIRPFLVTGGRTRPLQDGPGWRR
ncbi:hypothetical protein ACFQX7_17780 [Luedemannella flava]